MAGNERELGVSITARNTTSSAFNGAITELERFNLAVKLAGGSFGGLTQAQLQAIETTAGLKRGVLDATQSIEAQRVAFGGVATATASYTEATAAATAVTRESTAAFQAQARAIDQAAIARDAAVASAARTSVRTPVVFVPPSQTEGARVPNDSSVAYRAKRQAEAEAEALAMARASVRSDKPAKDFWEEHDTRMGYNNAPLDARGSGSVLKRVEQREDAAGEANLKTSAMSASVAKRFENESSIYAVIAATQQWENALKTTGTSAETAGAKIEGLYNRGSLKTYTLQEGINRSITSQQAFPTMVSKASARQDAAAAFGGEVERGPAIESGGGTSAARVPGGITDEGVNKLKNNGRVVQNELKHITAAADEFFRGQKGQLVGTIGSALRDAGLSAGALMTSFGGFVAIIAGAALLNGVRAMGEWAAAARAGAIATGMSIENFTQLQGAMLLVGGKATDVDVALKHLAETMTQAVGDPGSKAAKAFDALGVSQEMLVKNGGNVEGMVKILAQNLNGYGDSAQKAAAAEEILGRGMEKFVKLLDQGPEGLAKIRAEAAAMGYELTEKTSKALEDTGDKVTQLELKAGGDFRKGMIAWQPEINITITFLEHLSGVVGSIVTGLGDAVRWGAQLNGFQFSGLTNAGKSFVRGVDWVANKAGLAPTGKDAKSRFGPQPEGEQLNPVSLMPDLGIKKEVPIDWEAKAGTTSDAPEKRDINLELAEARRDAAAKTKSAGDLQVNEIKAEIAIFKAHIQELQFSTHLPSSLAEAAKPNANQKLLETLQTELANKEAELSGAQLRGSAKGQPTANNELQARIAQAKEAVEMLAGTTKDASIAGAEAAIAELQRTLQTEKLTAKERLMAETELANAKIALHNKVLAETQSKQIEQIKLTVTTVNETQRQDQISAKFDSLSSGKPENNMAEAKAQSLQVLAAGEDAIRKLQEMASSGNMTAESIQKINEAMANIRTDTMSRMVDLFNEAGSAAKNSSNIFANAWAQTFSKLDSETEQFSSEITKAVLAPQQELIKAGLTTIHVSLEGQQIRAAAQKVFLSLASDFVSSVTSGLSHLAAKKLFGDALPEGAGLGGGIANWLGGGKTGSGHAGEFGITKGAETALGKGKGGDLGSSAANLQAFNMALKTATQTLSQHSGSMEGNTAATQANTGATSTGASAMGLHAGATSTSTIATSTNAGATALNTAATASDTAGVAVHSTATNTDTAGFITHALDLAADAAAEIYHTIVTLLSLEGGGVVPSAAGGMVVGGGLGGARGGILSILHPHEMVLPRHLSEGVQGMINGGGAKGGGPSSIHSSTLNYSPNINAGKGGMSRAEMSQMMLGQAGSFAGEARNLVRKGWRP